MKLAVLAPANTVTLAGTEAAANYSVSIKGDRIASGTLQPGASETCVVPAGTLEVRWSIAKPALEHGITSIKQELRMMN